MKILYKWIALPTKIISDLCYIIFSNTLIPVVTQKPYSRLPLIIHKMISFSVLIFHY